MKLTPFESQKLTEYTVRYTAHERAKRWVGFDFDGTLAEEVEINHNTEMHKVGKPIPVMIERLKFWLATGFCCKIFTARMSHPSLSVRLEAAKAIHVFCTESDLPSLELTSQKDHRMFLFYDDRSVNPLHPDFGQVEPELCRKHEDVSYMKPEDISYMSAIECIKKALETVTERKAVYGNNHKAFGPLMSVLLPRLGISAEQWNKIGVVGQIISKLGRYCNSDMTHIDSAHDIIGYAGLLEELTREINK